MEIMNRDDEERGRGCPFSEWMKGSTSVGAPSWCDRVGGIVAVVFAAGSRSYV
jgi:hypothetical protein